MSLTDSRPETEAPSHGSPEHRSSIEELLGSGDHKTLGRTLTVGGVIGLIAGLALEVIALAMANDLVEIGAAGTDYLPQIWSLGRDLIAFGGLVPILIGIGIYLVPLQIGSPSLAFPRGAGAAVWTWYLGTLLLVLAYANNGGPGGGRRDFVVLWAASLAMMIGAAIWALVCLATTILGARTQGMGLDRVPATTWGFLMFAVVGFLQLPITIAELLMSFIRIRYELLPIELSSELTGVADGWSVGASLYWFAIPVLGFAIDLIGAHTKAPVRRHTAALIGIAVFALITFGADVAAFATLRVSNEIELAAPALIAASLALLAVLGLGGDSLRRGTFAPHVGLVGALLSGLLLLLATLAALLATIKPIMSALEPVVSSINMDETLIVYGTRFQEGIALLVIGSVVVGIIAALHHWANKIWGKGLSEPLGMLSIAAAAAGAVIGAAGEIMAGIGDEPALPARVTDDFAAGLGIISLVGAAVLAVGALLLGVNMVLSLLAGNSAGTKAPAWTGTTLEWATATPPVVGNFPAPPIVMSAHPLADGELKYVGLDQAEEG